MSHGLEGDLTVAGTTVFMDKIRACPLSWRTVVDDGTMRDRLRLGGYRR